MKSDFMIAITQLSAEKNLPKEVILEAVEAALASAYKKDDFIANQNISVNIDPITGEIKVYAEKTVVEKVTDQRREVSLAEARKLKKDAQIGDTIKVEATPRNAGRIAAQTAKQVVLQRLREAEHEAVFEQYADKEGGLVSGVVQRIEPRQIIIDLGRAAAILPASEQVKTERYRVGQRIRVYLMEVERTNKGPQLVVSRTHRNLLKCLFEMEVPEIQNGTVELKSIAREPGYRSKVAVAARQQGLDPVGSCVGLRGIRIQNIVNELSGEKIDVIEWHPDPAIFIANALSPAQVLNVEIDEREKAAVVVVPDRQLSLAIGKEGQNARLAAKLTGWRIDIKSASSAEKERAERAEQARVEIAEPAIEEAPPALVETAPLPQAEELLPVTTEAPVKPAEEEGETLLSFEETIDYFGEETTPPPERPQIRFAEDILAIRGIKTDKKVKKGKKKETVKEAGGREGIKPKLARRAKIPLPDEEELEEY